MRLSKLVILSVVAVGACGGAKATPATPPAADSAPPADAVSSAPTAPADSAPSSSPPAPSAPITLSAELPKPPAKPSSGPYPKPSVSYKDCWSKVGLTGAAQKDFDAIVAACGVPTGMLEYAAPSRGDFGPSHKQQVYKLSMYAGMCYRFIAAGDSSVGDLDVRVEKPDGALVAVDKTDQPVAIIDSGGRLVRDGRRRLRLEGRPRRPGKGSFVFGVWARPKK